MKEFEKWWEIASTNEIRYDSSEDKYVAEDGWKAALEWVLKNEEEHIGQGENDSAWTGSFIEEELEK